MGREQVRAGVLIALAVVALAVPWGVPVGPVPHPVADVGRVPPTSATLGTTAGGALHPAAARPAANPCTPSNNSTFALSLAIQHANIDVNTTLSIFAICRLPFAVQANATVTWNWTILPSGTLPAGCKIPTGSFLKCNPTQPWTGVVRLTGTPGGPNVTGLRKASDVVGFNVSAAVTAQLGADPRTGSAPLTVNFTATIDGGTAPFTVQWLSGDQNLGLGRQWDHTYSSGGSYLVQVWINDSTVPFAANQSWHRAFYVNVSAEPAGSRLFGLRGPAGEVLLAVIGGLLVLALVYAFSVRHRPPRLPPPERWMVPGADRPGRLAGDPNGPAGPPPGR